MKRITINVTKREQADMKAQAKQQGVVLSKYYYKCLMLGHYKEKSQDEIKADEN